MKDRPNILLITIDCLRSDHVSCYGYFRKTTPNIDKLAEKGVLYQNCISTSCWTLPSMASLITGLFPSKHGAHDEHQFLDPKWETLPNILSKNGYETGSIVTVPWLNNSFGMNRGIDHFVELKESQWIKRFEEIKILKRFRRFNRFRLNYSVRCRDAGKINKVFNKLISKFKMTKHPFFIHCHYFDCHPPFIPPRTFVNKFSKTFIDAIQFNLKFKTIFAKFMNGNKEILTENIRQSAIDLYDATIAYVDQSVGKLIKKLKEYKQLENTMILLTADHGILFGEHGLLDHNFNLYNSVLKVPLIIYWPEVIREGQIIKSLVQHTDILPSILEAVDLKNMDALQGKSILPGNSHIKTNLSDDDRFAYSELFVNKKRQKSYGIVLEQRAKAVQGSVYKYIRTSTDKKELYDIKNDPFETSNLIEIEKSSANQLETELMRQDPAFFKQTSFKDGSEYADVTEEVRKRLEDLRYM